MKGPFGNKGRLRMKNWPFMIRWTAQWQ